MFERDGEGLGRCDREGGGGVDLDEVGVVPVLVLDLYEDADVTEEAEAPKEAEAEPAESKAVPSVAEPVPRRGPAGTMPR